MMGDPVDPDPNAPPMDGGSPPPFDAGIPWDGAKPMTDGGGPPAPGPIDAAPPPPGEPPPPDAHPAPTGDTWSNVDKCNQMCAAYCQKRHLCDGTSEDACRAAIDADNGGPCETRGATFSSISQDRVEACIDAIQMMSCSSFLSMFNTGSGIPSECQGILN